MYANIPSGLLVGPPAFEVDQMSSVQFPLASFLGLQSYTTERQNSGWNLP